jgi:hypothetical protein
MRTTADGRVRVTLAGQFRSTGTFIVPAGATLGQIAKLAGGTLPEAFPRGARLFRKQESEVAKPFLTDLLRRTETSLAINKRAALDAEDDEAKDVIKRSGGLTHQADEDAVFVGRADGSVIATAQGDTLAWDHERRRLTRTSLSGLKLLEGDAVIIPADVRYLDSNRRIVRDWTQIMFQVAATVGTIAVIAK